MGQFSRHNCTGDGLQVCRMPRNPDSHLREADDHRIILHNSSLALVEDASVSTRRPPPSGYETKHQIALPYFGFFAYAAGRKRWLIDPNRILFISPGREFQDEHPIAGLGHAVILVSPSLDLLDEICGPCGVKRSAAFGAGSTPSSLRLLLLTQQLLHIKTHSADPLRNDELTIRALREAFRASAPNWTGASRVVDRAKEVLHARSCERICLEDVARAVGVSPVYLTQEFTRTEGVPLYRYQIRLRLSRALLELPHCDDITGLALDLGFSSHSHFTAAFRESLGMTPSDYRKTI